MSNELEFEKAYWGNCCNTFDEEQKHYVYARFMEIPRNNYSFTVNSKSVLDIGGGPVSMLLKTAGLTKAKVVDPINYPKWTRERYAAHGIEVLVAAGEEIFESGWDEVWIYNCLQHAEDPGLVIDNALKAAKLIRIFEWIDIPPHDGHPHELTKANLDKWLGTKGRTIRLAESGCYGRAYYAVHTSPYAKGH